MKTMKAQTREAELSARELPPEQVIAWLRSEEGDRWRAICVSRLYRHNTHSGIFGELIPDSAGGRCPARWPGPGNPYAV